MKKRWVCSLDKKRINFVYTDARLRRDEVILDPRLWFHPDAYEGAKNCGCSALSLGPWDYDYKEALAARDKAMKARAC